MDLITAVNQKYTDIKNGEGSVNDKNKDYADLMSILEAHYHIPLLMMPEYFFENTEDKEAFELWLMISNSRNF